MTLVYLSVKILFKVKLPLKSQQTTHLDCSEFWNDAVDENLAFFKNPYTYKQFFSTLLVSCQHYPSNISPESCDQLSSNEDLVVNPFVAQ